MRIRNSRDLFSFVLCVAAVAAALASFLDYLILPADIYGHVAAKGLVIAVLCATPIAWFVGSRLRHMHALQEKFEASTRIDRLTGLLNRQSFIDALTGTEPPQGVVGLFDIDHFKDVNDSLGHFGGDQALAAVAVVLRNACGPAALICRFGGEEFAVFFEDLAPEAGRAACERMVRAIEATPVRIEGRPLQLTISAGCAMRGPDDHLETALRAADGALYQAKAQGRNRLIEGWRPLAAPQLRIAPAA